MTDENIKKVIDEKGIPGFEIENDDVSVAWFLTLAEGEMIGKRIVEIGDDEMYVDCHWVSYANVDDCEDFYWSIIEDFVDLYGDYLYYGVANELALFTDFASRDDEGLMNILSLFGKTYEEFLLDVFYEFGNYTDSLLADLDDECCDDEPDVYCSEAQVVKSVLRHLCSATLFVDYDDAATSWEFAVANGRMWYRRMDFVFDDEEEGDESLYESEIGYFPLDDPDAPEALRDMVRSCIVGDKECCYEEMGDPFGLIGLDPDELDDE